MTDLRERFRALDEVKAPDLRSEILRRPQRIEQRSPGRRLAAAAVAASVAALGITVAVRAFLGPGTAPQIPTEPGPGLGDPMGSPPGPVEAVIDVEPEPGGVRSTLIPGWLLARARLDQRTWTLSVTRKTDPEVLCFHLNSGVACGGPTRPGTVSGAIGLFSSSEFEPSRENHSVLFVYGPVVRAAAEVMVIFDDGTTVRTSPIEGPPGYRMNFYMVGIEGAPSTQSVRALDEGGRVLGEVPQIDAPESPGP